MDEIKHKLQRSFIYKKDDALTSEQCDDIIRLFKGLQDRYGDESPSDDPHISHDWNQVNFRKDKSRFLQDIRTYYSEADKRENYRLCEIFFKAIDLATEEYIKKMGQGLGDLKPDGMKLHYNARGSHFSSWHYEYSGDSERYKSRVLVYAINLTDYAEGDEHSGIEFLYQGVHVPPKKGQLLMFPADFTHTHRGNPNYVADRYFATGWLLDNCKDY
jgi:hypothetical protein